MQRLARMVWGTFFLGLPGGVRTCHDGLVHFFFTFARLTEGGGLKLFGQCPYRNNTFQKGASLISEWSNIAKRLTKMEQQWCFFNSPNSAMKWSSRRLVIILYGWVI